MGEEIKRSHREHKDVAQIISLYNDNSTPGQKLLIEDTKEARLEREEESNIVPEVGEVEETEEIHAGEMEDATKQCHQEVHDQDSNNLVHTTITSTENQTYVPEQIIDDIEEARPDNGGEIKIENQNAEVGKVKETDKKHASIVKKPKAIVQQKYLHAPAAPQPLSLATEKKLARERQGGSMQTTGSKSIMSKSVSLNLKVDTQNMNGTKQISEPKCGGTVTSRPTLARNSTNDKRTENGAKLKEKVELKDTNSKNTKTIDKDGEETRLELKKSTTFKATPMPRFYHRKDPPPKPEQKKDTATSPKFPQIGLQSKSLGEGESAKDTIHRLLKGAWKDPSSQQKKVVKSSSTISHVTRKDKQTT